MEKFSLIITAGGTSSRYGSKNKLLEMIKSRAVIEYSVSAFLDFREIEEIIIPANLSILDDLDIMFKAYPKIKIIEGGNTRQESVYRALKLVRQKYVIIHDGARPLIDKDIIQNVINTVIKNKAVSVMTKTVDTIKEVDEIGKIIRTIDRTRLYNTQTPQAFEYEVIMQAHEKFKNKKNFTDDASMLEELNIPVYIIEGSYKNIKITSKSDLDFAKLYI
ncbi:2-C-methyl-D-erythritol 4-phosphate cytidylyltransferase [bacterium]|nr:2-C-methyl-D-erythritol 4-phosphate cytidylyltransferase [bacterium]